MAFDAFCYFKGSDVKGETQDKTYKGEGAFEILSFEIGAENNINIGSISAGGGAGKATFKELTVTKKTDLASAPMFAKLCDGTHFPDMVIDLRRSGGAAGSSGLVFLKFEFKMVMIQDISWSGSDGDDVCEETVVMQYGAMKVTYTQQKDDGKAGDKKDAEWSRVLNQANLAVK
ncbi:Hcp family type VI secretion system effector [Pseudooceanicola sp.]|uniref:Hcp family type VI secretion system effector n=1 Tax=Pseudooceanicola sp. TaxID=1914328 RepID=UPI0035C68503